MSKTNIASGIDISDSYIAAMSLDNNQINGYNVVNVEPSKIINSIKEKSDYLSEVIASLNNNSTGKLDINSVVAVAIPTMQTYSRTISLPMSAVKHLKEAVELEAEQYIPEPNSSLYIDYKVINQADNTIDVIITAAPRVVIDNYITSLEKALPNTKVALIEPNINSIARLLSQTEEGNLPTIILNIGAISTDIAIVDGGIVRVTTAQGIGSNQLTINIAKKLNISLDKAHQIRILNGLSAGLRQKLILEAVEPILAQIINEIRRISRYYIERINNKCKLEQLLIVGNGSNLAGIGEYFTNQLVIAARVANPWQKIRFDDIQVPDKNKLPLLLTSAGLASASRKSLPKLINLLPIKLKKRSLPLALKLIIALIAIILVGLAGYVIFEFIIAPAL